MKRGEGSGHGTQHKAIKVVLSRMEELLARVATPAPEPERLFPIQKGTPVPWSQAEIAYVTYRRLFGKSQSLERLAERGGFGDEEYRLLRAGKCPISGRQEWDPDRCPTCYASPAGPGVPVESETT